MNTHSMARTTDPETSHMAAETHRRTGALFTNRAACLRALINATERGMGGLTAPEVARDTGLARHEPSRRLPELRRDGLVVNGGRRRCTVLGTMMLTWEPANQNTDQNHTGGSR